MSTDEQSSQKSGLRIGLALSGGTLKAATHVGVISALEQLDIHVDCIAGTSAGSVVGSLYAAGYGADELTSLVTKFPGIRLLDYGFPLLSSLLHFARWHLPFAHAKPDNSQVPNGLLKGDRLLRYLRRLLTGRTMVKNCYITATDLLSGDPITFTNDEMMSKRGLTVPLLDDIAQAVLASCSLPGIFSPKSLRGWALVDGALRNYVPVNILRQAGCTHIIAVNLYNLDSRWQPESVFHVVARSFDILMDENIDSDTMGPDVMLFEPDLSDMSSWAFRKMPHCMGLGRELILAQQQHLLAFLSQTQPRNYRTEGRRRHATGDGRDCRDGPIIRLQTK